MLIQTKTIPRRKFEKQSYKTSSLFYITIFKQSEVLNSYQIRTH